MCFMLLLHLLQQYMEFDLELYCISSFIYIIQTFIIYVRVNVYLEITAPLQALVEGQSRGPFMVLFFSS